MTEQSKPPFFSVVIPVYNKEPYIQRSISSVLNQTFQDFELIIVCDPSTDNSNAEVAKLTDPRIHVFHRDEPGPGGYAARNLGIKEAKAEWIAFLDADDEWKLNHLEKMKTLSHRYPDVYFLGCGWEEEVENQQRRFDSFYQTNQSTEHFNLTLVDYLKLSTEGKRPVNASVACLKRSSEVALNLFPSEKGATRGGDLHAWLKVMCHHKQMAWSNHIGVKYFLDIEGQVVKSSPYSLHLYQKEVIKDLKKGLSRKEIKLLDKYLNKRLFGLLVGAKLARVKHFSIFDFLKVVHFSRDFVYGSLVTISAVTPRYFFTIARSLLKR